MFAAGSNAEEAYFCTFIYTYFYIRSIEQLFEQLRNFFSKVPKFG